jgi:DNA-binding Lrp family transcriptional regulator
MDYRIMMKNSGHFIKGQIPWNKRDDINEIIKVRYPLEGAELANELGISRSAVHQRASKLEVKCIKKQTSTEESRRKTSITLTGHRKNQQWCQRLSDALKGRPHNLVRLHRIAEGLTRSRRQKRQMTAPEKWVWKVLQMQYGDFNPYTFTGDRKFWITLKNGKQRNPDFVSLFHKKIIEVYGSYWHKGEDPKERISDYAKVGWNCLVLWEHELNVDDILFFTYPYEYMKDMEKFQCT